MKILILLLLTTLPAQAQLYKCKAAGKTSYQQAPCPSQGSPFNIKKEISQADQKAARIRLKKQLAYDTELNRITQLANDKERLIRAEENKAYAGYLNAHESARQADEMEYRNDIEAAKLRKITRY